MLDLREERVGMGRGDKKFSIRVEPPFSSNICTMMLRSRGENLTFTKRDEIVGAHGGGEIEISHRDKIVVF